ncbi:MAG: bifunctional adenosylcobinamide kinase/adenosylcobinamide-phosphate guanylyltransferase [Oscillospiraceae bacterium]|jgi:adenosylcobinamide kinase/adenosylcobinamide-phosphate guanylyltransferase|nr:bifunctional adenosylcobinamide kinase/adenosylcobinamide-phosphate guanylyltransferase [Oscillospiraceae bacterium]
MRVFISGGCKNGKSYYAQRLASAMRGTGLYYIATMLPGDDEDIERVRRHRRERLGWGFETVEQPRDIAGILQKCDRGATFLLDSLTALLANEMFPGGGRMNAGAADKVCGELARVLDAIDDIVVVSDYIYADGLAFDALTEEYMRSLAQLDRLAASKCDAVVEVSFSAVAVHKGGDIISFVTAVP